MAHCARWSPSAPRPSEACFACCAPPSRSASGATRPPPRLGRETAGSLDLFDAVRRLGPRTALLLLHARGDEQIPYTVSEDLYAAAREPKRLLVLPGGHHRSIQHDLELQALSRRFIAEAAGN